MQGTIRVRVEQSSLVFSQTLAVSVAQSLFNCRSQPNSLYNSYSVPGFELSARQPFPEETLLSWEDDLQWDTCLAVLGHTVPSMIPTQSTQTGSSWGEGPDSDGKSRIRAHSIIQHCIPLTFWRTSSPRMVTFMHTCIAFMLWPTQAHAAESGMAEMASSWGTQKRARCLKQGCQGFPHGFLTWTLSMWSYDRCEAGHTRQICGWLDART